MQLTCVVLKLTPSGWLHPAVQTCVNVYGWMGVEIHTKIARLRRLTCGFTLGAAFSVCFPLYVLYPRIIRFKTVQTCEITVVLRFVYTHVQSIPWSIIDKTHNRYNVCFLFEPRSSTRRHSHLTRRQLIHYFLEKTLKQSCKKICLECIYLWNRS